jgi:hypothetical protein
MQAAAWGVLFLKLQFSLMGPQQFGAPLHPPELEVRKGGSKDGKLKGDCSLTRNQVTGSGYKAPNSKLNGTGRGLTNLQGNQRPDQDGCKPSGRACDGMTERGQVARGRRQDRDFCTHPSVVDMGSVCEGRIELGLDGNLGKFHFTVDDIGAVKDRAVAGESNCQCGEVCMWRRLEREVADDHVLAYARTLLLCSWGLVQGCTAGPRGWEWFLAVCRRREQDCSGCLQKAAVWYEEKGQQFVLTDQSSPGIAVSPGPPSAT